MIAAPQRYQDGDFDLDLLCDDGKKPSRSKEKAFRHFVENRDMICNWVVDAIFDYYRANWAAWRGSAEPGEESAYAD